MATNKTTGESMKAILTASAFAAAWGEDSLVRLPDANKSIPAKCGEFLLRAGLPALVRCHEASNESKITFCRLSRGLSSVIDEKTVGTPLPSSWSRYLVAGDEFFCNGAAWWCIHQANGSIVRIDIELDDPVEFVNTSVAHFAAAISMAVGWSAKCRRTAQEWTREVDQLVNAIRTLDPPALKSRRCFWLRFLEFIREEDPSESGFVKGSATAGRRAWKAGSW